MKHTYPLLLLALMLYVGGNTLMAHAPKKTISILPAVNKTNTATTTPGTINRPALPIPKLPAKPNMNVGKQLSFIENKGQITDQYHHPRHDIQFSLSAGKGLTIFVGNGAIHYQWATVAKERVSSMVQVMPHELDTTSVSYPMYRMDVELIGANKHAQIATEEKQDYYESYFTHTTGETGATAHAYNRIVYKNVYPHVDWVLYTSTGQLKHEFVVHTGGKVSDIKLKYGGTTCLKVTTDGSLIATTPQGSIKEQAPYTYQKDGRKIGSSFKLKDDVLSYETGEYSGELVIDPSLAWATYYGGSDHDHGLSMTTDYNENVYVCGQTGSVANIATTGAYQTTFIGGPYDAFIVKFNSSGARQWATYYGGSANEWLAPSICADANANIYISGMTYSTSGIATAGAYQTSFAGTYDAFLAKFDSSGGIQWATYYGGTGYDQGRQLAIDNDGNICMAGSTTSLSGIATTGAYQPSSGGDHDGFLVKFNSYGIRLWATYYGSSGNDFCETTGFDTSGNIFIVGKTNSTSGIATAGSHQATYGGGSGDAFLVKFSSLGVRQWATYYGGALEDDINSISIDISNNIYMCGYTRSSVGIATSGVYQPVLNGSNRDAFLVKFDNYGNRTWGTYYGGTGIDESYSVAANGVDIYIVGQTNSTSNIATSGVYQSSLASGYDAYIAKFDSTGNLNWATYYGGNGDDYLIEVSKSVYGSVYFAGYTNSASGIASSGSYQTAYGGGTFDAYLVKFNDCTLPSAGTITGPSSVNNGSTITLSDTTTGGIWSSSNTSIATIDSTGIVTGIAVGTVTISYTVSNSCGSTTTTTSITVTASCTNIITTIAGDGTYGYSGDDGMATAAQLSPAYGLCVDSTGNIYIADYGNQRIRKINTSGIITTIAGTGTIGYSGDGGPATSAMLGAPTDVNVDNLGNVFIADYVNERVRKISSTGIISTIAGNGTAGYSGDGGAATSAQLHGPTGIAVDINGSVYIADQYNNRVRKVSSTGVITTLAGNGSFGYYGDGGAATLAMLAAPTSVAVDGSGNVYIADYGNHVIRKINTSGIITTIAGNGSAGYTADGVAATTTKLYYPYGVAIDGSSNVYIGDRFNNRVRKVNSAGTISTIAGIGSGGYSGDGSAATAAELNRPAGVTVDNSGKLFIADNNNRAIRKIDGASLVASITGPSSVNTGASITLSNATTGGTWSSSNTSVATVGSTGIVTGIASGTATISYTVTNACGSGVATKVITVNPTLTAGTITGSSAVCSGSAITLSNTTSGGSWSSSNTAVATVGSTGIVTGVAGGTVTISYTVTNSCGTATATKVLTVNAVSGGIPTSGLVAWYPFNGNANDESGNSNNGTNYGATLTTDRFGIAGKAFIFNGVSDSIVIPYVRDSQSFSLSFWIYTSNFSNISYPIGLGINPFNTVDSYKGYGIGIISDGSECGYTARSLVAFDGSSTCSNALAGSVVTSSQWHLVTYTNIANTGVLYLNGVNVGTSTSMNMLGILKLVVGFRSDKFGGFSGKVDDIAIYSRALTPTEVTQLYNAGSSAGTITGPSSVYVGATITLTDSTTGGTWSSSNTSVATVGSTGVVTGVTPGTVTISYTVSNACGSAVATKVVTVNSAMSSPITGTLTTCIGATTTLSNATTGGTWSSSTPAVATVGSTSGIVTGVSAGTSTITYSVGGSYVTAVVTVYAMPAAITGGGSACVGATITLACTTTGGLWSSSNTAAATIGSTGIVTGVASGTSVISYTMSGTCSSTKTITINPSPGSIGGSLNGCIGITNTLTCTPSGGAWSSSTPSVANINATGQATGFASGTTIITYGLSTGCRSTAVLTINALPDSVGGIPTVCPGLTTTLIGYPSGGNWSSSNTSKATVDASGIVTGVALGTARITYTNAGGCYKTKVVTVNAAPLAITGTAAVCVDNNTTLVSPGGGTWFSGTTSVATIGSTTGVVTGVSAGTAIITYRLSTGCINTRVVTVNDAPTAITGTANICAGTTTTLTSTPSGGTWSSSGLTVGTVGSTTGIVTGISGGAVTISYTIAGGCRATRVVTVNNNPPAIGGTATLATGGTTTLTNSLTGGAWSSGNTSVATVGTSGIVYGVSSGTAQISYTSAAGCSIAKTVTVSGAIGGITGVATLCTGSTTSLSCSPAGGTWSSGNTAVATVTSTGVVNGVSVGTATISYSISGTTATTVVTVYAAPAAIAGPGLACVGGTITFSNSVSGGTWSSSNTAAATIGSTGIVSGIAVGTTVISYQMAAGCGVAKTITVNATPSAITGTSTVCVGVSATLSCTPAGGAWSSETPSVANIDASGTYTGASAGTTTITYGMGTGCFSTTTVTVNALPGTISGTLAVCEGATSSLTSSTSGGTWSSSNTSVATVDASGLVTAVAAGNTTIAYSTGSGCAVTASFTVNPTPSAIGGSLSVCIGNSSTLTNASSGGTWSSSNTSVGTISASVGTLTGISAGVTTISYTATSGCVVMAVATVNDLPAAISGSLEVCASGGTTTLTCTPSGGTWSTTTPSVATIGSVTGVVSGVSAGTAFVTYTVGSGCYSVATITINAIPSAITGAANVCPGTTTTLISTTTGGVWSSGTPSVATVNTSGVVSGASVGTSLISYTVNGCATTSVVTVNALPSAISGSSVLCSGITQTFSATPSGGTWSSSNTSVGTINSTTGAFIGLASGNTTVTYKLATGCQSELILTINPSPAAISGATTLCLGTTVTLSTSTTSGAWSSSNPTVASVNTSGVVTGNTIGTANISYTLGSCHAVKQVTVNTAFTSSTTFNMCLGSTKTLVDSLPGGTWSSSTPAVATVVSGTGVATAMSVGMTTITYFFGTGCSKTTPLYVQNSNAVISGPSTICETSTANMTVPSASMGGSWTSSNPSVATINMSTGALNAVSPGVVTISYTLVECITTKTVTVNPRPSAITGAQFACIGSTTTLANTTSGGSWTSSTAGIATVGSASGVVTGVAAGTATISYTLATGCNRTAVVTIATTPATITGTTNVCVGNTITLGCTSPGGTWSSGNSAIASVGSSTGVVSGVGAGVTTISYGYGGSCVSTKVVTVNATPGAITGPGVVCAGQTITLANALTPGTWSSSAAGVATANSSTGLITGVASGTTTISYRTSVGGCLATTIVTVNAALPAITGGNTVCVGNVVTLNIATTGGAWSSSDVTKATIDGTSGVVTGVATGSSIITYLVSTGCFKTSTMLVHPLPSAISGASSVVVGSSTTLTCATSGGAWSSSNTAIGTVGSASGAVAGISVGAVTITFTKTTTGCFTTKAMTVNPVTLAKPGSGVLSGSDVRFSVYPNPNHGTLTIDAVVSGVFRIYTVDSRLVAEHNIITPSTVIQLPQDLASGVYMCRFTGVDGSTETVRLVYDPQ